jgi:predicted transcriptional regulator
MPNGVVCGLSRRERQIMDIIFARGSATAGEVLEALPDPPSYSAVRALLRVLEEKGRLTHRRDGARYVYSATEPHSVAARSALGRVVTTFFGGSVEQVVATLLSDSELRVSDHELDRLARLIADARQAEDPTHATEP